MERASRIRSDGWTVARQIVFLEMLARTRSVTAGARAAGMSRESAYRLRARDPRGLFAAAWARAFRARPGPTGAEVDKGHRLAIAAAGLPERIATGPSRAAPSILRFSQLARESAARTADSRPSVE